MAILKGELTKMNNNLEEYSDPISYDIENDTNTGELNLLTKWAIKQGGPIDRLGMWNWLNDHLSQ